MAVAGAWVGATVLGWIIVGVGSSKHAASASSVNSNPINEIKNRLRAMIIRYSLEPALILGLFQQWKSNPKGRALAFYTAGFHLHRSPVRFNGLFDDSQAQADSTEAAALTPGEDGNRPHLLLPPGEPPFNPERGEFG